MMFSKCPNGMSKQEQILVEMDEMELRGMGGSNLYRKAMTRMALQKLADKADHCISRQLEITGRVVGLAFLRYCGLK